MQALGGLPPEALLSGPPDGGDLLLQRTLGAMRAEVSGARRRRGLLAGLVAAGLLAAALAGGAAIGRSTTTTPPAALPPVVSSAVKPVAGTREGSATNPATGAALSVHVVPAAGWVRVQASVRGIAAGENCRLIVVSRDGSRSVAGGWVTSEKGRLEGTVLDGAAAVPASDLAAIEIENTAGKRFVSVKM